MTKKRKDEVALPEIDRTSDVALFNTARSYRRSAEYLLKGRLKEVTHPHKPVEFLFCHALELYLKAYLRATGSGVKALQRKGHVFSKLLSTDKKRGLEVAPEDKAALRRLDDWDVAIEARYIITGPRHGFEPEVFAALCLNLEHRVGSALTQMGIHVRHFPLL